MLYAQYLIDCRQELAKPIKRSRWCPLEVSGCQENQSNVHASHNSDVIYRRATKEFSEKLY